MKFIKYAVGLVIALSVIPMVVVAVTKLDEPRLKSVEFEVLDYDSGENLITFSDNTYNDLSLSANIDNNLTTNLVSVKLNNIELEGYRLEYSVASFSFFNNLNDWENLRDTNTSEGAGDFPYTPTIGDKWSMTFEVPNPTPPLVKLLVGFAPLLFIGGILLFMLNKRKLD